jgi:hypothetical protein
MKTPNQFTKSTILRSVICLAVFTVFTTEARATDSDNDGMDDTEDPMPYSDENLSSYNGLAWPGTTSLGDMDGDLIVNFYDSHPFPDSDGDGFYDYSDGILFTADPAPNDYTNFSSANLMAWYGDLFGDADGDLSQNYYDNYPYDMDNDGIDDLVDPYPSDYGNYSNINDTYWYSEVIANWDLDSLLNWEDPNPYVYDY